MRRRRRGCRPAEAFQPSALSKPGKTGPFCGSGETTAEGGGRRGTRVAVHARRTRPLKNKFSQLPRFEFARFNDSEKSVSAGSVVVSADIRPNTWRLTAERDIWDVCNCRGCARNSSLQRSRPRRSNTRPLWPRLVLRFSSIRTDGMRRVSRVPVAGRSRQSKIPRRISLFSKLQRGINSLRE